MSGQRIIESLKDAVAGNFASVTLEGGQHWVRREWQPIETAPRDGTWFMICCAKDGCDSYEVGRYEPMNWENYVEVEGGLYRKESKPILDWRGFNNFHRATHWAPVPTPPGDTQ